MQFGLSQCSFLLSIYRDLAYSQVSSLAAVLCYTAAGSAVESEGVGMAQHFLSVGERDIDRMISMAFLLLSSKGVMVSSPCGKECFVHIMDLIALSRFTTVRPSNLLQMFKIHLIFYSNASYCIY